MPCWAARPGAAPASSDVLVGHPWVVGVAAVFVLVLPTVGIFVLLVGFGMLVSLGALARSSGRGLRCRLDHALDGLHNLLRKLLQPLGETLQRLRDGLRHLADLLADLARHLARHVGTAGAARRTARTRGRCTQGRCTRHTRAACSCGAVGVLQLFGGSAQCVGALLVALLVHLGSAPEQFRDGLAGRRRGLQRALPASENLTEGASDGRRDGPVRGLDAERFRRRRTHHLGEGGHDLVVDLREGAYAIGLHVERVSHAGFLGSRFMLVSILWGLSGANRRKFRQATSGGITSSPATGCRWRGTSCRPSRATAGWSSQPTS